MPFFWAAIAIIIILLLLLLVAQMTRGLRSVKRQLQALQQGEIWNSLILKENPAPGQAELIRLLNELIESGRRHDHQLNAQMRALREQLSDLSHDLRTPLTALIGYIQLAESALAAGDREQAADYLTATLRRSRGMQTMVQEIYELSRYEDQSWELQVETADPLPLLEEQLLGLYDAFRERRLTVEPNWQAKGPVYLARTELERVYQNLLQNALRYAASHLTIEHAVSNGSIYTRFSNDLDPALAAEIVPERLFERFYTGDRSRNRATSGSGLGLYLARLLMRRMGGDLSVTLDRERALIAFDVHYKQPEGKVR